MPRDFFDPPIEQCEFVLIDRTTAEKALPMVAGCEVCRGDEADIPLHWILDRVTGRDDPSITDYVLR
jgi:hypothetical protein